MPPLASGCWGQLIGSFRWNQSQKVRRQAFVCYASPLRRTTLCPCPVGLGTVILPFCRRRSVDFYSHTIRSDQIKRFQSKRDLEPFLLDSLKEGASQVTPENVACYRAKPEGLLKQAWELGGKRILVAALLFLAAARPTLASPAGAAPNTDDPAASVERSSTSQNRPDGPPGTSSSSGRSQQTRNRRKSNLSNSVHKRDATGEGTVKKRVPRQKRILNASTPSEDWKRTLRMSNSRDVSYLELWGLVEEGHIDKMTTERQTGKILVNLKPTSPVGACQLRVDVAINPEMFQHMVAHGLYLEPEQLNDVLNAIWASFFTLVIPCTAAFFVFRFLSRTGEALPPQDQIFGSANLDLMEYKRKNKRITFKDVAGIDEVKQEIMEIAAFLKNPARFKALGAHPPKGVLMIGAPGTGKTLLARAIAGEADVPFFSTAGTEFMEMYVGVGAARIRDMFQQARSAAPCILFIDEFDGLGKERTYSSANDESVHTINQLLTEMDGFDDNTGVVVMGATNRPGALDSALTRPGRFDRIIHLPLPNLSGRAEILEVHSRGKKLAEDVDFRKIALATAGFTGADMMNIMSQSTFVAMRQRRYIVKQDDIVDALEEIQMEKASRGSSLQRLGETDLPPDVHKSIAVYEAGTALIGLITPNYDELQKISVCPNGIPIGNTFFIPQEERLESRIVTQDFMESEMVVCVAGRCAERLLLGEGWLSARGAGGLDKANYIAKQMIYRCGFSKYLGPVPLMESDAFDDDGIYKTRVPANISTELASIALAECQSLVEAAEAKALYGLLTNRPFLEALVEKLTQFESLRGNMVAEYAKRYNLQVFPSPFLTDFGWSEDGELIYPGYKGKKMRSYNVQKGNGTSAEQLVSVGVDRNESTKHVGITEFWNPQTPYRPKWDLPNLIDLNDIQ